MNNPFHLYPQQQQQNQHNQQHNPYYHNHNAAAAAAAAGPHIYHTKHPQQHVQNDIIDNEEDDYHESLSSDATNKYMNVESTEGSVVLSNRNSSSSSIVNLNWASWYTVVVISVIVFVSVVTLFYVYKCHKKIIELEETAEDNDTTTKLKLTSHSIAIGAIVDRLGISDKVIYKINSLLKDGITTAPPPSSQPQPQQQLQQLQHNSTIFPVTTDYAAATAAVVADQQQQQHDQNFAPI